MYGHFPLYPTFEYTYKKPTFSGTSEESRITIAHSKILIHKGKITQGIELLEKIQPQDNYFFLAKKTLADIYLFNKKNREMYAQCYQDLVDNCPNSDTFSTLGDAFMSIQVKKKKF